MNMKCTLSLFKYYFSLTKVFSDFPYKSFPMIINFDMKGKLCKLFFFSTKMKARNTFILKISVEGEGGVGQISIKIAVI